VAAN
jgi:hypothetical protein